MNQLLNFFTKRLVLKHWFLAVQSWFSLGAIAAVILTLQLLVAAPASAIGTYDLAAPADNVWVVDKAEVLSRTTEGKISAELSDLAKKTGNVVHFVTIRRLDYGETIQSFTDALFEQWFPTPEAQANQTLLVVDNLTNNSAIRTGAEIKEIMPDAIATSVAQETVLVPLKEGEKYNQAFLDASDRLVAVLSGKEDPGPPQVRDTVRVEGTFATPEETKSSNATAWVIGFLVVATIVPMATYYFYLYLQSR